MGRKERVADYFSKRLRKEREHRGWSQAYMAKLLSDKGIPAIATTIAKIEAGDRAVRIDEATGIADLFEVSLDLLLGRRAGLENELTYTRRALLDTAQKSFWDVNAINLALRDKFGDLLKLELGRDETLESEGKRALDALTEAQEALFKFAWLEEEKE